MRVIYLAFLCAIACVPAARGDEATDLRDRAMKAHFQNPSDIKKYRTVSISAKGTVRSDPEPTPATWEVQAVWPRKMRATYSFGGAATKNVVTMTATDDRGWIQRGNLAATDFSIEQITDYWGDAYAIWVATVTTLGDAENKLSTAPGVRLGSDTLLGLKVSRRPWPDVTLYFDSKTSLLRKLAYTSRDAGTQLAKEQFFSEHKDFGGIRLPTKQTTNVMGTEFFVWKELSFKFPDAIDPKVFAKP